MRPAGRRLAIVAVVTALAAMTVTPAHAAPPPPRGTLIMVGGALSDDNAEIYREIVARAGGAHARIGVITAASIPPSRDPEVGTSRAANSAVNGRLYVNLLKRYGAGDARWLPIDLDHAGAADSRQVVDQVKAMTGFVFGGGDQMRLVTTLLHGPAHTDSAVLTAIRAKFEEGALVAGTSAGAQIQEGADMVTGGASYQALRDGPRRGYFEDATVLGYLAGGGFGFFADGLVDTHFSALGRLGRAVRLASDTGHTRVFGLDPDTALESVGGSLRVLGRHGVSVLDLRHATPTLTGGHWAISGVRWTYLTRGSVYLPGTWAYRFPPGSRPLAPADQAVASPVPDIFDSPAAPGYTGTRFTLTRAAIGLAGARRSATLIGTSYESDPRFAVELRKGPGFLACTSEGAVAFADLSVSLYSP